MNLSLRSIATLTALGLASAACGEVTSDNQPNPASVEQPMEQATTAHGFVQMLGEALSDVVLTPEQDATVRTLGAQVEPLQIQVDQAENELLTKLADQVKTGAMDRAALEPSIAGYATARTAMSVVLRSAVEKLHEILDPDQRVDFAEALESRVYEVTQATMSADSLDEFATELNLSEPQKQAIRDAVRPILENLKAERKNLHQTIEAFRGDTFSVEQYLPQSDVSTKARARAQGIVDVTFAIVNALDPAQRQKVAARIAAAAAARSEAPESSSPAPSQATPTNGENVGAAVQLVWAAGRVARGPYGGVRGGVVVGGARGYYGRRAVAYPAAAGWGYGW